MCAIWPYSSCHPSPAIADWTRGRCWVKGPRAHRQPMTRPWSQTVNLSPVKLLSWKSEWYLNRDHCPLVVIPELRPRSRVAASATLSHEGNELAKAASSGGRRGRQCTERVQPGEAEGAFAFWQFSNPQLPWAPTGLFALVFWETPCPSNKLFFLLETLWTGSCSLKPKDLN